MRTRWRVTAQRYVERALETARRQWPLVIMPGIVLWLLAAVVSIGLLHPFDVTEYQRYAHAALEAPLFHHLPTEYPAPAVIIFILPLAIPLPYPWAFAVLVGIALIALLMSYEGAGLSGWDVHGARRLIVYMALGSVMVLAGRFDVFAVGASILALRAAKDDRWSAAWTWSVLGFLLKLFPAVLWPAFIIAEWRQHGRPPLRRLAWVGAGAVVIAGIPALLTHGGALTVARYYLHRPPEIGSIPAGLSVLIKWGSTHWVESFHSANVISSVGTPVAQVVDVVAVAGCVVVWWWQVRGRLPLEAVCLATLSAVVVGSKVLSVQYVMWLMPLWALYRLRWSWLAACLINLLIFPYDIEAARLGYTPSRVFAATLTLAFLARDLLIAFGTGWWLRSVLCTDEPSPGDAAASVAR